MPRYLGQHFLKNQTILEKIEQAIDVQEGDLIVEIGPGHGELTEKIKNPIPTGRQGKSKVKIIGIEKDRHLSDFLEEKFLNDKDVKIICGDALKILPVLHSKYKIQNTKYKLVGNIPYYITGHLLRIIGELKFKPTKAILLIQKEVALRICAQAPHSNLLSMSVGFWAKPKIIMSVSAGNFSPPPEVESAVLELSLKNDVDWKNADKYYSFIRKAFKQPRKTLINNLVAGGVNKKEASAILEKYSLNGSVRPQNINPRDVYKISLLF